MAVIDVFNGDADGICALLQLRLYQPTSSQLVTGVKRDIQLLRQLQAKPGDSITVLDISYQKNAADVERLLAAGANIFYCDHHQTGELAQHLNLKTIINTQADVCTSLLINGYLQSRYASWAIVGAFGDNLFASATALAKQAQIATQSELQLLEQLGTAINYNAYGLTEADLHLHPADLFQRLLPYSTPQEFVDAEPTLYQQLLDNYQADLSVAARFQAVAETSHVRAYVLPNTKSSRRVSGVFANQQARQCKEKAHAVITDMGEFYQVSVRAPLANKQGAAQLCSQFATGGGRAAAAGINQLEKTELERFLQAFIQFYSQS